MNNLAFPSSSIGTHRRPPDSLSSLSSEIDVLSRTVRVTYHTQPTFAEWSETVESAFADDDYQPGFGVLLDCRAVFQPAETGFIKRAVAFVNGHLKEVHSTRWAILVSNLGAFGMARMAELLCDREDSIRACWSEHEAESWLNRRG